MSRRLAITAVVLFTLAAPAAASAKEISKVAVCGKDKQCVTYDKSDTNNLTALASDDGPTDPPSGAAPWYRIRFTVDMRAEGGGTDHWSIVYVPSANSLRVRDESSRFAWVALTPQAARLFRKASRQLTPYPAAQLRGLHPKPIQAAVDEVYTPPVPATDAATTATSGTPWGWIAGAILAAAALLAVGARAIRSSTAARTRGPSARSAR